MSYHQWVTVYSPAQISLIDCIQTHSDLILGCISKCQGLVSETALYGLLSHVKSKFKSLCAALCLGLIRKQLNEKLPCLVHGPLECVNLIGQLWQRRVKHFCIIQKTWINLDISPLDMATDQLSCVISGLSFHISATLAASCNSKHLDCKLIVFKLIL